MRILYFHQHFSTPRGKTGTRSYEFAQRLLQRGHQVTMVCGASAMSQTGLTMAFEEGLRRGNIDGIDVIELAVPYSNYDGIAKRAATFLRFAVRSLAVAYREDYDLLFATSTPLTAALPGIAMRLTRPSRKFVFEVRDLWPELPRALGVKNPLLLGGMSLLEKCSYLAMHAGVGLSPGIQAGMRRRSNPQKPIKMIPNGCDLELFRPATDARTRAIDGLEELPEEGLRCIFTGAHGQANGLDAALDTAKELQKRERSDIQLIFVGDGKLKPQLIARAAREGLTNCHFLDPLPKLQLAELLQSVDVGMMLLANVPAFYYGTSPNKFFDYISAGLPVVNNYPGWLADLIQENECGAVAPPENCHAFAETLIRLADDRAGLAAMGRRARKLAEREFNRGQLADAFVDFLEQVPPEEGVRKVHPEAWRAA